MRVPLRESLRCSAVENLYPHDLRYVFSKTSFAESLPHIRQPFPAYDAGTSAISSDKCLGCIIRVFRAGRLVPSQALVHNVALTNNSRLAFQRPYCDLHVSVSLVTDSSWTTPACLTISHTNLQGRPKWSLDAGLDYRILPHLWSISLALTHSMSGCSNGSQHRDGTAAR